MPIDEEGSVLHVVMFPWLAIGHLIPFLELSKCLASKGHRVSFLSTPRNIQRLPKIPPSLSPFINLINLPFPLIQNLPQNAQSSTDIPIQKTQLLKKAFDMLQPHFDKFLHNSTTPPPDWIIYDYASHWLPELAAKHHIPCAFFGLFNAATLSFFGPPWALLNDTRFSLQQDFTVVPKWIPFASDIVYRLHELLLNFEGIAKDVTDIPDSYRFGVSIRDCDFVALRSCVEFEPEWINLLTELYQKPVIPVGSLHPSNHEQEDDDDEEWVVIREWLEKEKHDSVVYVALGSEATLSQEQVNELALGLERSDLPFIWVLRAPPDLSVDVLGTLPSGFLDRTRNRGIVYTSWVPQVKILGHSSVGVFLTHCGWNSVIEGLGFGRVLVLLPILNDQGLTARLLQGKMVGLEIPRNERDGSFTSELVAESLRIVLVNKEGELMRSKAREMKGVFGDKNRMDHYGDGFVQYLKANKRRQGSSSSSTSTLTKDSVI